MMENAVAGDGYNCRTGPRLCVVAVLIKFCWKYQSHHSTPTHCLMIMSNEEDLDQNFKMSIFESNAKWILFSSFWYSKRTVGGTISRTRLNSGGPRVRISPFNSIDIKDNVMWLTLLMLALNTGMCFCNVLRSFSNDSTTFCQRAHAWKVIDFELAKKSPFADSDPKELN